MPDTAPSDLLHLLTEAIDRAPSRCSYVETRHVATETEGLLVRNGRVARIETDAIAGVGVRVRVGGGWGFAASREET
ncbi:MAG: TldD/PmbA family protein, partial [Actinobacteria bacterium]|nr:TldD/PmbA family protein [Actinomycetota bacterium]